MALFITFEGGEGCGKSTQAKLLYQRFKKMAVPAMLIHEPGKTILGEKVAKLLKWSEDVKITPLAELLLFNVSRAQLVTEVITPKLKKGINIICDRYADSTTTYQGYGRGLDLAVVKAANKIGTQGLMPDLTIFMDMPVEKGMARKQGMRADRMEKESLAFHKRVRAGYLKLAKAEPKRWLVIDALQGKEAIEGIIWQKVGTLLPK